MEGNKSEKRGFSKFGSLNNSSDENEKGRVNV